eukprot:TRINITY_DN5376_c0_g1_i10.p1 TRINITY_DN5376_c0_g1~~TRINITY_DN5376_c0_g1_i10.p1  ORF type:complete len:277 (+),score=102.52 TRINITY_DN5376_c0_g1_i10:146-976(+)
MLRSLVGSEMCIRDRIESIQRLREGMIVEVRKEVEGRNAGGSLGGGDSVLSKKLQDEVRSKEEQLKMMQDQLHLANTQIMRDSENEREIEAEMDTRELQVRLMKSEIEYLMAVKEEQETRLSELEERLAASLAEEQTSPESTGSSEVTASRRALSMARIDPPSPSSTPETPADLRHKLEIVQTELRAQIEECEFQKVMREKASEEKLGWQEACQMSHDFNVKLNQRIRELEEQQQAGKDASRQVRTLADDLEAKNAQIAILQELLQQHEEGDPVRV